MIGRARMRLQDVAREQHHQLVAEQDRRRVVDDADPVGVAVERDAHVGAIGAARLPRPRWPPERGDPHHESGGRVGRCCSPIRKSLTTRLERAACWTCKDAADEDLAGTRLMRSVEASAAAPGLEHRGFLENAGLTHGGSSGAYLTGDLCPSKRPLDRAFLEELASKGERPPIALSISGLWLLHHFEDYQWLLRRQAEGAFEITWVDHSYHHQFRRGVPYDRNFMLTPGVDPDAEILDTERLLIANGQTPSLFFRFPGLISSAPLMQAARRHHLIALGADAWLAIGQRPRPGSIVLVHPNGNEEIGLKMFDRDLAQRNDRAAAGAARGGAGLSGHCGALVLSQRS